jgi:hypothetical protein
MSFQGLSNGTTLMQIQSGQTVPLNYTSRLPASSEKTDDLNFYSLEVNDLVLSVNQNSDFVHFSTLHRTYNG